MTSRTPRTNIEDPIYWFFDDSYTLAQKGYAGQDRMSMKQFVVMGVLFVLIIALSLLLRKAKKEKLYMVYRVMAIVMPLMEIAKIIYSSYFDIINGQEFNWGGILPFYTCSMLLYFLPFLAWGKGKMKQYSMAFFSTIGMVAGLTNFVYLSAAGWYPIFTYGCMYSILYHGALVFVGMSLLITEEYKPTWKSIFEGLVPVWVFSFFVIPINFTIKYTVPNQGYVDYMLLMNCNGLPYIGDLGDYLASLNLSILFSMLMLVGVYPLGSAVIVSLEIALSKVKVLFPKAHQEAA
ncbi:MAG: YwaF family protein [Bacilli bacterium]|nr:YwaF family protein [Bacilli bacterium]